MARLDELKREAQAMQSYLEVNVGGGDANELMDRLDTLGVYYARSGAMHAEVVGLIDSAIAKFMDRAIRQDFPIAWAEDAQS